MEGDTVEFIDDDFGPFIFIRFARVIKNDPLTIEIDVMARDEAERRQEIQKRLLEWGWAERGQDNADDQHAGSHEPERAHEPEVGPHQA